MHETESYLSKVKDKQLETWSQTTKLARKQADTSSSLTLRTSPTRSKDSKASPKNVWVRKADYLINVSRDKSEYKGVSGGKKEKKYSGSLFESFADKKNTDLPENATPVVPKRDAKLIWTKLKESDVVPCLPDIFTKIVCTDDVAPYGSRHGDQY